MRRSTRVCNPEGAPAEALLAEIMDKTSLVVVEAGADAQPRLAMLDTVREFAAEQVAPSGEMILLELRHAHYFLAVRRARGGAGGARRPARVAEPARARARATCASPSSGCCGRRRPRTRCGSRSRSRSALPWDAHAHEVRGWLQQALKMLPPEPSARRAAALYWDGQLALSQARFAAAEGR